jgi:hypothetical protein
LGDWVRFDGFTIHILLVVWNMNFIFPNSWDDDPIWLILFKMVKTTNQYNMCPTKKWIYFRKSTHHQVYTRMLKTHISLYPKLYAHIWLGV